MGLPATAKVMSFISTRDRARAIGFYRDALGAPLLGEDDFAAIFDLNGTPLRITTIPGHEPSPHTALGWLVGDLSATLEALRAKGVAFEIFPGFGQDADGVWTSPDGAARVAWFKDPDGNILSLTQIGPAKAQ